MSKSAITQLNAGWGICGFTSALCVFYEDNSHGIKSVINKAKNAGNLDTRMLAEMKTYLNLLKADNESGLLDEIESFAQTFKGYETMTIEDLIELFEDAANGEEVKRLGIAMTPAAIIDYMARIGSIEAYYSPEWIDDSDVPMLIGLSRNGKLVHWVYQNGDGEIYNWGKRTSISELEDRFDLTASITF